MLSKFFQQPRVWLKRYLLLTAVIVTLSTPPLTTVQADCITTGSGSSCSG